MRFLRLASLDLSPLMMLLLRRARRSSLAPASRARCRIGARAPARRLRGPKEPIVTLRRQLHRGRARVRAAVATRVPLRGRHLGLATERGRAVEALARELELNDRQARARVRRVWPRGDRLTDSNRMFERAARHNQSAVAQLGAHGIWHGYRSELGRQRVVHLRDRVRRVGSASHGRGRALA